MAAVNEQPPIADETAHALDCLGRANDRSRAREAALQPAGKEQLTAAIEGLAQEITNMGQELRAEIGDWRAELRTALRTEIGDLRVELRAEVQALRC